MLGVTMYVPARLRSNFSAATALFAVGVVAGFVAVVPVPLYLGQYVSRARTPRFSAVTAVLAGIS